MQKISNDILKVSLSKSLFIRLENSFNMWLHTLDNCE